MNKRIKKKWVKALRSGKYKQAKHALRRKMYTDQGAPDGYGYCCLGVLCDVEGLQSKSLRIPKRYTGTCLIPSKSYGKDLTSPSLKKVGLSFDDTTTLIRMNDHIHFSFEEIADYIEKNL